ncbi:MAG: hypothetical protein AAFU67_18735, partial [Bacteroidota bacterium]
VGLSVGIITPNRIGEIGGRLLMARKEEASGVVTSFLLGGIAQWMAFALLALPALLWVGGTWLPEAWQNIRWVLFPLGPLFLFVLWWGGIPLLKQLLVLFDKRWGIDAQILIEAFDNVNFVLLARSSAWAAIRFAVYVGQLYLLLYVFGLQLPILEGCAGIATIYFIQAGIPLPPGVNFLTRAELGILLWGQTPLVTAAVVAAFATLFFVNVLLPAIFAYWLVVKKLKDYAE